MPSLTTIQHIFKQVNTLVSHTSALQVRTSQNKYQHNNHGCKKERLSTINKKVFQKHKRTGTKDTPTENRPGETLLYLKEITEKIGVLLRKHQLSKQHLEIAIK